MKKLLISLLLLVTVAVSAQEINIGAYWPLTSNNYPHFYRMQQMGFNHVWRDIDYMPHVDINSYFENCFKVNLIVRTSGTRREADLINAIDEVHPVYRRKLLAVHLGDEPLRNNTRYPLRDLERAAAVVKGKYPSSGMNYGQEIHRDHQRYPEWLQKHFNTFDKISLDLYTQHHGNTRIYGGQQNFIPYSIELVKQYAPNKPVWIILQGIGENVSKYRDMFARELRYNEFRYQTWISLLHGVEGVSYWWPADSTGNGTALAKIKTVVAEVRALEKAFLAPIVKQRINGFDEYFHQDWKWDKTKPQPIKTRNKAEYRVTKKGKSYWLFVVNNANHGIMFKQRISKWLGVASGKWRVIEYDHGKPVADSIDIVRVLRRHIPAKTLRVYRIRRGK